MRGPPYTSYIYIYIYIKWLELQLWRCSHWLGELPTLSLYYIIPLQSSRCHWRFLQHLHSIPAQETTLQQKPNRKAYSVWKSSAGQFVNSEHTSQSFAVRGNGFDLSFSLLSAHIAHAVRRVHFPTKLLELCSNFFSTLSFSLWLPLLVPLFLLSRHNSH